MKDIKENILMKTYSRKLPALDMVKRYLALVQSDIEDAYKGASPVGNWNL